MESKLNNSFFNQLLSKIIHYYSHDYYRLTKTTFEKVAAPDKMKVLIVARQHYLERHISLPITLKKDVKAAMAFELAELQQAFHVFYKVINVIDGVSHITIWQIPRNIIPKSVRIVLPESFLLANALLAGQILQYTVIGENKSVFIAKTQTSFQSMVGNTEQLTLFSQATGVNLDSLEQIDEKAYQQKLLSAVIYGLTRIAGGFWCTYADKRDVKAQLKPYFLPIFVVAITYMIISSAYISLQHENVLSKVNAQKSDIDKVLILQGDINSLTQELNKFSLLDQDKKPLWNVWSVLAPLFDQKIIFKFIRFNSKDVFFSAYAPSAATVLEYLLDKSEVDSASFTTAVRKKYGREEFIIKFSLSDHISEQEEQGNEK